MKIPRMDTGSIVIPTLILKTHKRMNDLACLKQTSPQFKGMKDGWTAEGIE